MPSVVPLAHSTTHPSASLVTRSRRRRNGRRKDERRGRGGKVPRGKGPGSAIKDQAGRKEWLLGRDLNPRPIG